MKLFKSYFLNIPTVPISSLLFLFLTFYTNAHAQSYWQQQVDTKIEVTLNDKKHFLHGYEELTYTNNSPDTLRFLYIHLWPNAYKNDRTPYARQLDINHQTEFYYSKPEERGYIDSLQFVIDGQNADHYSTDEMPDVARIDLSKPLLPGGKITITTPFRVKIPKVFSRLGYTRQAYFLSQWFPKPAVYDQKGWHAIPYLDQGEFYSNYGSYDVAITLPDNYIVMATGNCTDEKENNWLDSLSHLPMPEDTLYTNSWPKSSAQLKTIHFHEDNIHDFAWFADKRWIVRKDTFNSPSVNVTAWAAFLPQHKKKWQYGTDHLKTALKYYGQWVGAYPYKTIKAVEGDMLSGGGMEYPTVTIIDKSAYSNLKSVIVHEAGHNWFYGILGSNEREHPWMDEGINTFYETRTTKASDTTSRKKSKDHSIQISTKLIYKEIVANHTDQPTEGNSTAFTRINYGVDVYFKTPLMLEWLAVYMGQQNFEDAMHDYYTTWQFKHPYPEDFQNIIKKHTTKSIDWFFTTALATDKRIDFSFCKPVYSQEGTAIKVKSKNDLTAPAIINVYRDDSLLTSVQSQPFSKSTTITLPDIYNNWTRLTINDTIPDGKTANNQYRRYGLFHRSGLKIRPIAGLNTGGKENLFVAPAFGYNAYDGFQLGLLFHNITMPENRFRFAIAPMYAFNSQSLTGAGSVGYWWYPENIFKEIVLQGDVKSFNFNETQTTPTVYARYFKLAPSLNFTFNEHNPLSSVTRTITLKGYYITEDNFSPVSNNVYLQQKTYGLLRYKHNNTRTYNPFQYTLEGQANADFAKISAEGKIRIDYFTKKKALYVRGYVGKFFAINDDPAAVNRYYLNSTFTGANDYLYDDTYLGRMKTNNAFAQQVSIREGGFKVPLAGDIGRSDNYLASINLKTDLPLGRLPVRLFLDGGLIPNVNADIQNPGETRFLYDGGIEIHFIGDILLVNIPIVMSSDFQNYLKNTYGNNQFMKGISFTIQLQNINWLAAPSKLLKMAGG